nr:uncharacterized mitochondrial protein AtMg00810-like [Tanacetum cinerariifolium]
FEDPDHPDKVYKVVKPLYGLHQAPRAWSMIGSLIYLTSSRPDIMFAVCVCARFQVTPKASHLYAVKRIFRYLKGKPHLGLWYPKDSPFDLVAYSDSDYAGASLDRKSTIGGCQFLGCKLIFWKCKKQIVVATSSTEAEYVAAASCCAQVLWIQNQLLDYGDSPLLGVNTLKCDEDRLELMELTVFLLPKFEKVGIRVNVVDLQVSAVRKKLPLFSLTNWCCSLSAVSYIKYALTVNPNIYVSCIKQFWTTVAVKQVNDVTRLQALVDKKKVVVTVATIREALYLDDAEGVDFLPNGEIFAELTRIGYEKPSLKLTSSMASVVICLSPGRKFNFSKYIFDSLVRNVYSPTKFYMYPRFLQLMIRKKVGDLSTHTTKYTFPALTQKVFTNMRRVGKGFSGVETPLFESMLVEQQVDEEGDEDENVQEVNAGDAAEGDVSAAHGEVPSVVEETSIPSPTPPTPPPQPSQDIPSTSQVQQIPPQSPQVQPPSPQPQPQPQQAVEFPMNLLQEVMDACVVLTREVKHLEFDKFAQALEISKLKRRVKKLKRRNKERMIAEVEADADADVVLEDVKEADEEAKEVAEDAKVDENVDIQGRQAESQAEIYKIDLDYANKVLSMQEDETEPAEVQKVVDVVTTVKIITEVVTATIVAAPSRRRKGVVIKDPESESTTSTIIPADTKSKDKGKGILVEEPKPLKKKQQIKQDKQYARELHAELNNDIDWDKVINHVKINAKEDPTVKKYQALKRKPQTEAQARKNRMLYLKNTKEQIEEDENRALQKLNETQAERATKGRKLDEEAEELKRYLQIVPNEDDDVYIEATP